MGKIKRLDDHLTNMIAAGEVVERPSAVLKELIENALDAHAKYIEIKIEQGGIKKLEVIDDGDGMDESDVKLAFDRHSTSKISQVRELFAPLTLGFRGEALPSIASVSKVSLKSSNGQEGAAIIIDNGVIVSYHPQLGPQGTSVIVENLFQKVPARFKHLKSIQYEASLLLDLVEKFALSYRNVAFKVSNEDKVLLKTSGNGSWEDVLAYIMGNRLAHLAHTYTFEDHDFSLDVCYIEPSEHRSNPKNIYLFINHRIIRHYSIQKVIVEAFSSYLPAHRYPIICINITMDASLVDVNVHPSKWEVKLSKEQQLTYLIYDSLVKQFKTEGSIKDHTLIPSSELSEQIPFFDTYSYQAPQDNDSILAEVNSNQTSFPVLDVLGQLHGQYILASSPSTLYIIDQHAAKERINFESILKQMTNTKQRDLLLPLVIEVKPSFSQRMDDFNQALEYLMIQVEPFSINSIIIRKLPLWISVDNQEQFILNLIDRFLEDKPLTMTEVRHSTIATMACHKSVRFNQNLSHIEMKHIIEELSQCDQPYNCPHGRPTLIKIETKDLWKDFER
ncbi:MAG: DNA mismatch repair endonuclease MutL [Erysipelotrichaceae bacterium]